MDVEMSAPRDAQVLDTPHNPTNSQPTGSEAAKEGTATSVSDTAGEKSINIPGGPQDMPMDGLEQAPTAQTLSEPLDVDMNELLAFEDDKPSTPTLGNVASIDAETLKARETAINNRTTELFEKHRADYERAWLSEGRALKTGDVISRVVNEGTFQFDWLFDTTLPANIPPPRMTALKPYDPTMPPRVLVLTKSQEEERAERTAAFEKKTRNWYYHHVHKKRAPAASKKSKQVSSQLNGIEQPSKARTGFQLFEVEEKARVAAEVKRRWESRSQEEVDKQHATDLAADEKALAQGTTRRKRTGPTLAYYQSVVHQMYDVLLDDDKAEYTCRAVAEAHAKKEEWKAEKVCHVNLRTPKERQLSINNIGTVIGPVLEEIHRQTGLLLLLNACGPMPSESGQLGYISWCVGKNRDPKPQSFLKKNPTAAAHIRRRLLTFAATAFTSEDIAAACPVGESSVVSTFRADDEIELDDDMPDSLASNKRKRQDDSAGPSNNVTKSKKKSKEPSTKKTKTVQRSRRASTASESSLDDEEQFLATGGLEEDAPDVGEDSGEGDDDNENEDLPRPKRVKLSARKSYRPGATDSCLSYAEKVAQTQECAKLLSQTKPTPKAATKKTPKNKPTASAKPATAHQQSGGMTATVGPAPTDAPEDGSTTSGVDPPLPALVTSTLPSGPPMTPSVPLPISPSVPVSTVPERSIDQSVARSNTQDEDEPSVAPAPATVRPKPRPAWRAKGPVVDMEGLDVDEEELLEHAGEISITAPESLSDVLRKMREKDAGMLGRKWDVFVADMVVLDSEEGFMKPLKALPVGSTAATKRPKMLTDWQNAGRCRRLKDKNGRKADAKEMPLLDAADMATFVTAFKGWYGELQPAWREREGDQWAKRGYIEGDMGPLNTRGMCGWLSVAACLWWWGLCAFEGEDTEAKQIWETHLDDAAWMLRVVRIRGERDGK